jgi:hypothetical protein
MPVVDKENTKATRSTDRDVSRKPASKRYNLVLPNNLFEEVQALAEKEDTSVLDLLKRLIRIGVVIDKLSQSPDTTLIVREGDRERELMFL